MKAVVMPALGVAMSEGLLLRWLRASGDTVAKGEPLLEIETDKSVIEVESPTSGVLGRLLFEPGASVPVGVTMAHIVEPGEPPEAAEPEPASEPPAASMEARPAPAEAETTAPPVPGVPHEEIGASARVPTATQPQVGRAPNRLSPRERQMAREQKPGRLEGESDLTVSGAEGDKPPFPTGTASDMTQTHVVKEQLQGFLPMDIRGCDVAQLREWLGSMLLIRDFEATLDPLSMSAKIPGGLHLSIGQEAVAVGAARGLQPQDLVACAHRSHHHALAKGLTPRAVMAELFGKATGCRGGRGGSMHLADMSLGFLGGNGIVGAGLGIAMGASLAAHLRHADQVAVGFFGDGGANTGRTWEHVNIAAVWKLPLIIVCENNMYAVETETERLTGGGSISRRAEGFGLPVRTVDGQDVVEMFRTTREARERAARGEGPTFIEAMTYRYEGHSTGQVINYRTIEQVEEWRGTKDPVQRLRIALHEAGELDDDAFERLVETARATVADAIQFAEESPLPDPDAATSDVTGLDLGLGNAG